MATGQTPDERSSAFPSGQRLRCMQCGSEIAIVQPCPRQEPNQVFRCCGEDMVPSAPPAHRLPGE
jgi:hypothetical protein